MNLSEYAVNTEGVIEMDNVEILLAEDNPNDAELTIRAFRKNNLSNKIFITKDGAETLDFIFNRGKYQDREDCMLPKLVLLDLKLPKVNGLEVLEEIKKNELTKVIPVVMMTSSKEDKDIEKAYKLGANSYIVKPIDFRQFYQAVAEVGLYWMAVNQPPDP
jgi:two-component system response regulator